jgi:hypothetical protein
MTEDEDEDVLAPLTELQEKVLTYIEQRIADGGHPRASKSVRRSTYGRAAPRKSCAHWLAKIEFNSFHRSKTFHVKRKWLS